MSDWGEAEGLSGLVVRDPRHLEAEVEALASLKGRLSRRDTRVLTTVSPIARFPPDRSILGSVYATESARRLFSTLALGQNVRTFRSPWSQALYWYLNELVIEGGDLIVPARQTTSQGDRGWSVQDLQALFHQQGDVFDRAYLRLRGRPSLPRPPSLLPWFVDDLSGVVHTQILARTNPAGVQAALHDPVAGELVGSDLGRLRELAPAGDWLAHGEQVELTQQLGRLTRSVSYLMSGLAHKAAAVRFAIADYGRRGPQSLLDIGGAFGFLAAELLLDPELDVHNAVALEYDVNYLPGTLRMYRALAPQLRNRLQLALRRAEAHPYGQPVTVVTMMSSLLYVPADQRRVVLDGSWESLQAGGILVIYEVLRTKPPMKDDAIQYTSSELDAELERYGPIVRLSATTLREVSAAEAGETTVFRVVVKR